MAVKKTELKEAAEKSLKKTAAAEEKTQAEAKKAAKAEKAVKETKTKKTEKKDKPARKTAAKKTAEKAAEIYFEFAGKQVSADEIAKAVEAACKAEGKKSKGVKIYVKAEDNAAYYVAENGDAGKLDL